MIVNHKTLMYQMNAQKKQNYDSTVLTLLDVSEAQKVHKFHSNFREYYSTPLLALPALSQYLGLGSIHVKDESKRFGLNAFKVLGGAYAIGKYLAGKLDRDVTSLTFEALISPSIKKQLGEMTFVTATDGNHGRGVAWAAHQLGQKAVVYMPKGSCENRAQNIRNHGAECIITDLNYDGAVRLANQMAENNGWIMVQDTAWDGYEEIPTWIMQGYMTLAYEALQQLQEKNESLPTHIFLQAGVGSFAGAVAGFFVQNLKDKAPKIIIMEPHQSNCLYLSAVVNDGQPHAVGGDMLTLMAGLACGEPNTISWPILRDYATCFLSVDDSLSANGMRILAAPKLNDPSMISGESGAIGAGVLYELMKNEKYQALRECLALDNTADVLLISTEGDTSPEIYEEIVWLGRNHY